MRYSLALISVVLLAGAPQKETQPQPASLGPVFQAAAWALRDAESIDVRVSRTELVVIAHRSQLAALTTITEKLENSKDFTNVQPKFKGGGFNVGAQLNKLVDKSPPMEGPTTTVILDVFSKMAAEHDVKIYQLAPANPTQVRVSGDFSAVTGFFGAVQRRDWVRGVSKLTLTVRKDSGYASARADVQVFGYRP